MNRDEQNEKIEEYGRGFDLLKAALDEIPREAWTFQPAPHEWSAHEIIIHMKDSECMGVVRLHKLVAEPGGTLMTYEAHKWGDALDYRHQDSDDALEIFRLARRTTHRLLRALPEEVHE